MQDPDAPAIRLLILGGTTEAAAIARAVVAAHGHRVTVISSLAGRTERPGPLPGEVRIGGFGGVEGLVAYLQTQAIDVVVDATHPFAAQMSRHARIAAALANRPRLQLWRPGWPRDPRDRWVEVADAAGAASVLPQVGRRVLLTLGRSELDCFAGLTTTFFLIRSIDPPRTPPPLAQHHVVLGRGPFALAEELALLRHYRIDALVAKHSGGSATKAKLDAARTLDLPVVMIRRPPPEPGHLALTVDEALAWLSQVVDGDPSSCAL
ncbi:MAG: cobalt-precorrin-6A reductase [Alphaproteobacteria bacterium]|nr:cobalt-precorrin-6A reductase [Alphaproteobacteria bacterium]